MKPIFYTGTKNASSWGFRAWLALREQDIDFEERVVDIRVPQRFANLAKISEFSDPAAVPVLVDDGVVIYDSLAIMEYASELGTKRLLPIDAKKRAHTRSLVAWQHSGLSGICGELSYESAFYPDRREMTEVEISQSNRLFAVWEKELKHSGGPYLSGELSLADLMFMPTVVRLLAHQAQLSTYPLTRAWTLKMMARASVQEWMQEAAALPPVILDAYYD
jgi:glutathione S-transferase